MTALALATRDALALLGLSVLVTAVLVMGAQ